MSNLHSRSHVPREVAPAAVRPQLGGAIVVVPCECGAGPISYPGNPVDGDGAWGATVCSIVRDERVELTFSSFDDTNYNDFRMNTRGGNYFCLFTPREGLSPYPHYVVEIQEVHPGFGNNLLAINGFGFSPVVSVPSPGDVWEFSSIGNHHAFKINGSTIIEGDGVNPILTRGLGMGVLAFDNVWTADLVTEDYCT